MKLNIALSEQAKAKIHTHKKSRCSFDYLNESYCND